MTWLWITSGAVALLLIAWRLRVATRKVDRILDEERAASLDQTSVADDMSTPSSATDQRETED